MARDKACDYGRMRFVPVLYEKKIVPGSFGYSLSWLTGKMPERMHDPGSGKQIL